jgi:hypothetical protein
LGVSCSSTRRAAWGCSLAPSRVLAAACALPAGVGRGWFGVLAHGGLLLGSRSGVRSTGGALVARLTWQHGSSDASPWCCVVQLVDRKLGLRYEGFPVSTDVRQQFNRWLPKASGLGLRGGVAATANTPGAIGRNGGGSMRPVRRRQPVPAARPTLRMRRSPRLGWEWTLATWPSCVR